MAEAHLVIATLALLIASVAHANSGRTDANVGHSRRASSREKDCAHHPHHEEGDLPCEDSAREPLPSNDESGYMSVGHGQRHQHSSRRDLQHAKEAAI